MTTKTKAIRMLNDELRQNFTNRHRCNDGWRCRLRPGNCDAHCETIGVYDDFCHTNDPCEEDDFGSFEVDGHTIFFKIDYFDKSRSYHSPDPADPSVTERVITIMLAEEY